MLQSLGFVLVISLLILAALKGKYFWLPKRPRQSVFDLTASYCLPYSPARIYAELSDLSKWWYWYGHVSQFCQVSEQPGIGQVLFAPPGAPFNSLEIVQAWHDRRLRLMSQSLANASTTWEEFDLLAEGAFCRLQWNTRVEFSRPCRLSRIQRKNLKKTRQEVVSRFLQYLENSQH